MSNMSAGDEEAITHEKECVVRLLKGSRKNTTLSFSRYLVMHDGICASNTYLHSTRYKQLLCYRHGDAWRMSIQQNNNNRKPTSGCGVNVYHLKQNPSEGAVTP